MNQYPAWKYLLILAVLLVGGLYAFPNLYPKDPAVQVTARNVALLDEALIEKIETELERKGIAVKSVEQTERMILVRLEQREEQETAADALKENLDNSFTVALNLAPSSPGWLTELGAEPMVLGLDLQGGVHFLLQVDMEAAKATQLERYESDFRVIFREERVRRPAISASGDNAVRVRYDSAEDREKIESQILADFPELSAVEDDNELSVRYVIADSKMIEIAATALDQNITALRNRVNALGVAEPIIQQQGSDRIVVQLPGIQDTVKAKEIIGRTATLEYRAAGTDGAAALEAERTGRAPPGFRLFYERNGNPVLLNKSLIVSGDQLIDASSGFDPQNGQPQVNVTLNNVGANRMLKFTTENVNKPMAVVYKETVPPVRDSDNNIITPSRVIEEVISIANVNEPFGKNFRTTGLDPQEAKDLALFLRAGALAAPVEIVEERTVGPSLGAENIERGFNSVVYGFVAVLIFMAIYYKVFGLVANLALAANVVMMIAILSLFGATLTMPGIAGIVLTVGMAVDANVLIFERIREEIANGNSPQASIRGGYDKAFSTIADANITTFIAAIVLFSFGTGPIKGFAITLSIGIATSMFTAIMGTRAVVNLIYGRRQRVAALSI